MNNKVKFLRGTSNEYAVAEKDSDTIYFTTDDGKLYIGDKEVSGSDVTIDDTLSDTSTNPVQNKVVKHAIDNKADKTVATTSADGLMSAEDKSKLDAFEITTTGGKLHDKDIVTTDLIPTTLPANGGNADTVDNLHASDFAKATNPSIEGEIHLLRSGNATTNGIIFAWEETVRIRNEDPNAENTTYTDLIVTPLGLFTERMLNGGMPAGREKLLTQSDIQTNIAGNTIFVKPNTNFPTINSAISKAVSEQKSYTIYISEGTYIEDLDLRDIGNISLEFVGVGNVSVSSNTAYPQGALYCMSNCIFRNISFFANNSYAVHIEFNNTVNSNGDYATYKNIRFENCIFGSQWTQCVGIGLGQGCTVMFVNCVMQKSFYAHNQAANNISGQGIRLNGCQIYGNIQIDDAAYSNGFSNSVVNLAITNTSATEFVFVKDRSVSEWVKYDYIPNDETNVILDVISGGNSYKLNGLNNGMSIQKYQFQNVVANSTVSLGHLDKFVLPLPVDYTLNNTVVSVSTDINSDWVMLGTGTLTSNSYVIPYYNYYTDSISGNIILTVVKL